MPIEQVTPPEAKELLDANPDALYIDVRTQDEFAAGHAVGAINIPVAFPGAGEQMEINPDFLSVVEAVIQKETKIVCGCQVGIRSQSAAEILEQAGYLDLTNMRGGFGGLQDATTGEVIAGWEDEGYPVESIVTEQNSYEAIKSRG